MAANSGGGFVSIMAHFDLSPQAEARGRLAAALAKRFQARLIGVAAEQMFFSMYEPSGSELADRIEENERARVSRDVRAASQIFDRVIAGYDDVEWRPAFSDPERHVIDQARAADLVILGRQAVGDGQDPGLGVDPAIVALQVGRPILVTPPERDGLVADKVVVAWKDTREARRAIRDALPFLKEAGEVVVVSATDTLPDESQADVVALLKLYGVAARPLWQPSSEKTLAQSFLDLARDVGADLIVCGAYGRSRLREWVFGGVTRSLLQTSPICLFMSH